MFSSLIGSMIARVFFFFFSFCWSLKEEIHWILTQRFSLNENEENVVVGVKQNIKNFNKTEFTFAEAIHFHT